MNRSALALASRCTEVKTWAKALIAKLIARLRPSRSPAEPRPWDTCAACAVEHNASAAPPLTLRWASDDPDEAAEKAD